MHSLFSDAQKKNDPTSFAKTITSADLKRHLFIVAGKEMEGRETATAGQRKAAAYIEGQFRSLGLLPAGDGAYQSQYPLYQDSLVTTMIKINERPFELNKDFSINVFQNNTATYRFSEIVFVKEGIINSSRDDYHGLDVRGKAVLMLVPEGRNRPDAIDVAQRKGAAVILTISGNHFPRKLNPPAKGYMGLTSFQKSMKPNQFIISERMAEFIMGSDYAAAEAVFSIRGYSNQMLN